MMRGNKKRALKLKRKSESEKVVAGVVGVTVTHSEAPGEGPPSPTSLLLPVWSQSCHSSERDALRMLALFPLPALRGFLDFLVSSPRKLGWFHSGGFFNVVADVVLHPFDGAANLDRPVFDEFLNVCFFG